MATYIYDNGIKREMTDAELAEIVEVEEPEITEEDRISALEDALAELIEMTLGGENDD